MMFVLSVALSRAVPLLLVLSLVLIAGRFLHDRYHAWNPRIAAGIFAATLAVGVIGTGPYVLRSSALVAAEICVSLYRWAQVDRFYSLHYRLGGRPGPLLHNNWVTAVMNLGNWAEAERVILLSIRREGDRAIATPESIYLLGVARYYQGRFPAAEKTLSALPDSEAHFLKPYLLGRIAERAGRVDQSVELYERCVALKPDFLAAVYHAVRHRLERGDREGARSVWSRYRASSGGAVNDPLVAEVEASLAAEEGRLPDLEFRVVQFHS